MSIYRSWKVKSLWSKWEILQLISVFFLVCFCWVCCLTHMRHCDAPIKKWVKVWLYLHFRVMWTFTTETFPTQKDPLGASLCWPPPCVLQFTLLIEYLFTTTLYGCHLKGRVIMQRTLSFHGLCSLHNSFVPCGKFNPTKQQLKNRKMFHENELTVSSHYQQQHLVNIPQIVPPNENTG